MTSIITTIQSYSYALNIFKIECNESDDKTKKRWNQPELHVKTAHSYNIF